MKEAFAWEFHHILLLLQELKSARNIFSLGIFDTRYCPIDMSGQQLGEENTLMKAHQGTKVEGQLFAHIKGARNCWHYST